MVASQNLGLSGNDVLMTVFCFVISSDFHQLIKQLYTLTKVNNTLLLLHIFAQISFLWLDSY